MDVLVVVSFGGSGSGLEGAVDLRLLSGADLSAVFGNGADSRES